MLIVLCTLSFWNYWSWLLQSARIDFPTRLAIPDRHRVVIAMGAFPGQGSFQARPAVQRAFRRHDRVNSWNGLPSSWKSMFDMSSQRFSTNAR
ncbi:MAG: hypothetical protein F4X92_07405 [Gammaproteobacteria bacterium]|nr:hypothetical protein [Gammaproteobacteria bacterium]